MAQGPFAERGHLYNRPMEFIATPDAPDAIGPYSQAVKSNGILYCSGQIALDPETMEIFERWTTIRPREHFVQDPNS